MFHVKHFKMRFFDGLSVGCSVSYRHGDRASAREWNAAVLRLQKTQSKDRRSTTGLHGNTRQNSLEFDMDVKKSILKFSTKDLKGKIRKIKKFEERENDESEINRRLK